MMKTSVQVAQCSWRSGSKPMAIAWLNGHGDRSPAWINTLGDSHEGPDERLRANGVLMLSGGFSFTIDKPLTRWLVDGSVRARRRWCSESSWTVATFVPTLLHEPTPRGGFAIFCPTGRRVPGTPSD